MKSDDLKALNGPSQRRFRVTPHTSRAAVALAIAALTLGTSEEARAQSTAGPYSNYNWNTYYGMPYYNPGYGQYGFPGVGVSPWNPIVQQQLNLGLKTARFNMYSAWADQSNAAANLYYQQAMAQAIQNQQAQQALQPRYDVRTRAPKPVPPDESSTPKSLPKNEVLGSDGRVLWPAPIPSSETLDKSKAAAEGAIRVAVKEFEGSGKATIQSVGEAKSLLFAFGKPALEQLARANREEAKKLLRFFASLEQVLNSLAGEE
jgi:hypothetical protein